MSISKSELRIQQLQDEKGKNLRALSALTLDGKEHTPAAKALQEAVDNAEKDISSLRFLLSHPVIQAANTKEEQMQKAGLLQRWRIYVQQAHYCSMLW